jgi:glycosyltransferase involved in cell wall biosynthesis
VNPRISVVIATYNRLELLEPCIESVRESIAYSPYEIVVVDGGSEDDTLEWCKKQDDVNLFAQGKLVGAIPAFNTGFRIARGKYVVHVNDDCVMFGNLCRDASYLDHNPTIGQLAFPHKEPGTKGQYVIKQACGRTYANFGMTRKWLGKHCGWWGNLSRTYGGDPHLSLTIWSKGYTVEASPHTIIDHSRHQDDLRAQYKAREDNNKVFGKWGWGAFACPEFPLITEEQYKSGDIPFLN